MQLITPKKYDLMKLANINNIFSFQDNTKNSKKIFNTAKNNVWFEFRSIYCSLGLYSTITIQIISEKLSLCQKLKDYEKAFIFLKKNPQAKDISMEIDIDENCYIEFYLTEIK